MNISKKVPVIVTIVLVLLWSFLGFLSAERIQGKSADPAFFWEAKLTEDVTIIDMNKVLDTYLSDEKEYDHTDIPAGSVGNVFVVYSRRHHAINDPETDVHSFRVSFYINETYFSAFITTGSESQLSDDKIYYKKIENYEELISLYNQKVKEAKTEWGKALLVRILTGIAVAAVFSAIFFIECIVANKIKMHPVVFGIICFIYSLMLLAAMLFGIVF
ncbi:MAG: hypothetical protein IKZ42_00155 [Clostridiales bacterium]|nr:hypothetical protein [Clostridiales bacterium]